MSSTDGGGDPAQLLAAINAGMRVRDVIIPRRFEHIFPTEEEMKDAFAQGRLNQFNDVATLIERFLRKTGQEQKIAWHKDYAKKTRARILAAREWPRGLRKRALGINRARVRLSAKA